MDEWRVDELLKSDAFGRVERVQGAERAGTRRVACGGRLPFSRLVARLLLARERRALNQLRGAPGFPQVLAEDRRAGVLVRSWVEGAPLHQAEALPEDFFERLDELVGDMHAQGVCHNDLHKEQNVIVGADGYPHLIDFQLASRHARAGRLFRSRVRDDLRHVQKHRRRYTRDGRGPGGVEQRGEGFGVRRSWVARVWRRTGKPLYNALTRKLLRTRDGEERRPSSGPWPRWAPPVGPRPGPRS